MAKCEWAHLCDNAFYDEKGKPCLIGIFRAVSAKTVPTTHASAALAFRLTSDPGHGVDVRIRLLGPKAGDCLIDIGNVTDVGPGGEQIIIVNLRGVVLPDYGPYKFELSFNGQVSERVEFSVVRPAEARNGK